MPANLIVAVVLLAVEALKTYRAQQEKRSRDDQDPDADDQHPRR